MSRMFERLLVTSCRCRLLVKPQEQIFYRIQPMRLKGSNRVRAPPVPKEKAKYIPRAVKLNKDAAAGMTAKERAEFEARVPVDDVWITKHYPTQTCSLHEAIKRHCELAAPEMFDCMNNPLFLQLELDMSTKKKTKFINNIGGTVLLPHKFNDGIENRVLVITKEPADQEVATQLGAEFVGGTDILKKLESGVIKLDDFDYVILNLDLLLEATIVKKLLKDRFPSKKRGNLGSDIAGMVQLFVSGREFSSDKQVEGISRLIMPIGQLSMTPESLYDNCKAVIEAVSATKPASTGPPIVKKIAVTCPPSPEMFYVHDPQLLPAASSRNKQIAEPTEEIKEDKEENEDDD